jgi:tetratricopeptide (TPR) repeat protein
MHGDPKTGLRLDVVGREMSGPTTVSTRPQWDRYLFGLSALVVLCGLLGLTVRVFHELSSTQLSWMIAVIGTVLLVGGVVFGVVTVVRARRGASAAVRAKRWNWAAVDIATVLLSFLLALVYELIVNTFGNGQVGETLVLIGAVALIVMLVVRFLIRLRAGRRLMVQPLPPSGALLAQSNWRAPNPLYGRDDEVDRAVGMVLAHGVVVVAGPRDVGTTAVAGAVVQTLIDKHGSRSDRTLRLDLRSRSTRPPDGARRTAARILWALGLDEPADDTPQVLAKAAQRLLVLLDNLFDVLLLDNVADPDEVAWLVREWPVGTRPRLVLAGETAISAVAEDRTVLLGELNLVGLRAIWDAMDPNARSQRRIVPWGPRRRGTDAIDELLRACFGRPRAVLAFAQEIYRPGTKVTVEGLLRTLRSAGSIDGQLERVWTAILDHIRDGLPPDAVWLLQALAELPVTALTGDAIAAMSESMDALEELRIRNLVLEVDGRYRMPTEIRRAIVGTTKDVDRQRYALKAIPALLKFHCDQIGHRPGVLVWFHDEERSLRPLFDPENYLDEELLTEVMRYLPEIADALEAWYVREQQSSGLLTVNRGLHVLAERAHLPDLAALTAIRMATAHRMADRLGDANEMLTVAAGLTAEVTDTRTVAGLKLREEVERSLLGLSRSSNTETLDEAEASLRRIVANRRPRGLVLSTALINLGAVCVRQNRPADALHFLRRAEKAAQEQGDTGGQAHAIELQGVATAHKGDLHAAVDLWQRAKNGFTHIGEEQGRARCLQHLGSASLVDQKVAGQIRDGRRIALGSRAAAEVALPLLEEAQRLREGQPDTTLVDKYLAVARARLAT